VSDAAARAINAVERAITTARHDLAHLRACQGCDEKQANVPHEMLTFQRYIADLGEVLNLLKGRG
jgi:hypothetical protein